MCKIQFSIRIGAPMMTALLSKRASALVLVCKCKVYWYKGMNKVLSNVMRLVLNIKRIFPDN
jgi:hypothetical protein